LLKQGLTVLALLLPDGNGGSSRDLKSRVYEFWDAFKLLLMFFTAVHSRGQNYGGGLVQPSFLSHRLS